MEKEEGDVLQIRKGVSCFWPHDCDPSRGLRETSVTVRPAHRPQTLPIAKGQARLQEESVCMGAACVSKLT